MARVLRPGNDGYTSLRRRPLADSPIAADYGDFQLMFKSSRISLITGVAVDEVLRTEVGER